LPTRAAAIGETPAFPNSIEFGMTLNGLSTIVRNDDVPVASTRAAVVAYSAPMAVFLIFTSVEGRIPLAWYPAVYAAKVCAVAMTLAVFRGPFAVIRPTLRLVAPAILVGLAVFIVWIGFDRLIHYPHLGSRVGFDPFTSIAGGATRTAFIVVRLTGLVLLVPVMEELFWRAFLLRYMTVTDFMRLPVGTFSWSAFWVVAAAFGIAHSEWLAAVVAAIAYGLLLRRTRSVFAAVVAHATTNAALGAYILLTAEWVYW
jgi:uncharacterized protein